MAHHLFYIPWHEMLMPKPSWAEKIVRPLIVYLVLLVVFRVTSKRELAQATLFDFLIILLISNVVQNAIIGEDNSVLGAIAGAITLLVITTVFNRVIESRKARVLLEGDPVLLVHNGKMHEDAMKAQDVNRYDLFSNIRKAGIACLADVGLAVLELDGTISIIRRDDAKDPHDCLPPRILAHMGKDPAQSLAHDEIDKSTIRDHE
jgi:uncharacterized membrane protein YcaP (DUF421 family)